MLAPSRILSPMVSALLREAVDGDAEGLALLLAELGYPARLDHVRARIASFSESATDEVLVAVIADRVVGLATLNLAPLFAEGGMFARLTALVVSTDHRGKGLGRRLVHEAEGRARSAGCTLIQVSSGRRPERAAAHHFYARLGYSDSSEHHAHYEKRL